MSNASVRMALAIILTMVIVTLAHLVQVLVLDLTVDLFWMNAEDIKNALARLELVLPTTVVFVMTKTMPLEAILEATLVATLVATLEATLETLVATLEATLEATLVATLEPILAVVLVAHLTVYLLINGNCSMKHAMEMFASTTSLLKLLMDSSLSTS